VDKVVLYATSKTACRSPLPLFFPPFFPSSRLGRHRKDGKRRTGRREGVEFEPPPLLSPFFFFFSLSRLDTGGSGRRAVPGPAQDAEGRSDLPPLFFFRPFSFQVTIVWTGSHSRPTPNPVDRSSRSCSPLSPPPLFFFLFFFPLLLLCRRKKIGCLCSIPGIGGKMAETRHSFFPFPPPLWKWRSAHDAPVDPKGFLTDPSSPPPFFFFFFSPSPLKPVEGNWRHKELFQAAVRIDAKRLFFSLLLLFFSPPWRHAARRRRHVAMLYRDPEHRRMQMPIPLFSPFLFFFFFFFFFFFPLRRDRRP